MFPLQGLRGEALAPLRAAAPEDRAAGTRRHAGAETMLPLSPAHVWLVGPLHTVEKVNCRPNGPDSSQYRRRVSRAVCPHPRGRRKVVERATGVSIWCPVLHSCG